MTRVTRFWVTVTAWVLMAGAVVGKDLPPVQGSESDEFKAAVSSWLDGNDLESLRALSELARAGNTAAQILLGRISETGAFYEHLTMPREERIALLKQPGGLSGLSWLLAAEESDPLAAAFLQSTRYGQKPDAVQALFRLGEPAAAMKAGLDLINSGEARALVEIFTELEDAPRESWFLALEAVKWADASAYRGSARVPGMGLVAAKNLPIDVKLTWLTPPPADLAENADLLTMVADQATSVTVWTPLAAFCKTHCADSVGTCIALGAALAPGSPFPFQSPTERLVPNETY